MEITDEHVSGMTRRQLMFFEKVLEVLNGKYHTDHSVKKFIPPIKSKDNKQELTAGDLRAIQDFQLMVTEKYDETNENIKGCLNNYVVGDYTEPEKKDQAQKEHDVQSKSKGEEDVKNYSTCKLAVKEIMSQNQFDEVYSTASPSVRESLLDSKYAISSS